MARQQILGVCQYCQAKKSMAAMAGHIKECLPAHQGSGAKASAAVVLLRVTAPNIEPYWLDLAVKPNTQLKEVDRFLRKIWLECCGHMSQFQVPPRRKIPMATSVGDAFPRKGSSLGYEYDFGSTTELRITVLDRLVGSIRKPIELAARNEAPPWQCDTCGKPATEICAQCIYDEAGLCCPAHAKTHECGEEMLLPVVNSPRMGVCGYTGEV